MPTYEYVCRDCGDHLEVVQSFKDDALTTCPACEGTLRKVFSAAGIIFKGSGWHVKDYGSGRSSGASGNGPEADTTAGNDSGGSGGGDGGDGGGGGDGGDGSAGNDAGGSKDTAKSTAKDKDSTGSKAAGGTSTSSSERSKSA